MDKQNEQRQRFADVLKHYLNRQGNSLGQLAQRSGIPKRTIANWVADQVRKPRHQMDLIKLARALNLSISEANEVLQSVGYPTVEKLIGLARRQPDEEQLSLLSPWIQEMERRDSLSPFQVIADLPHFVGRERELETLKKALLAGQHVTIYSLEGMGGVGKTTLAAHLAYQLRPHFPDGVLWARLDISDTMAILGVFAGAYGRDVSQYTDVGSRSQAVRDLLAYKRALLVLDNVRYSEEIESLLPPSGNCAVIITTRRRDLSATRGTHRFYVEPFDRVKQEAFALFVAVLGVERSRKEHMILKEIADLLGHLPLAVDIAASRLAYEPGWSATDFLERIRQETRRLNELEYENLSVRVSFNLSYKALPPGLQQFFAALGAFDGEDFDVEAIAYVTKLSPEEALDCIRKLYGLSLVQVGRPGRYRLHPLLHDYVREKIAVNGVFERMVEFFVRYAEDHCTDINTLELESGNLLSALQTAFDRGMQPALVRGANALARFLEVRGLYALAKVHLARARRSANDLGDAAGLASIYLNLGRIERKQGHYAQAERYFQEGLTLARRSGDHVTISSLLGSWGWLVMMRGEYAQAEGYFQEALSLAQESGHLERISTLLADLGVLADFRGDYERAEKFSRESLTLARQIGHHTRISDVLINLGALATHHGNYEQAEKFYRESLALAREIGYYENVCSALENLGEAACHRRDYEQAEKVLEESLSLARELGLRELIVRLLRHLGNLSEQYGRYEQAEKFCREGLAMAREMRRRVDIGVMLGILGTISTHCGDYVQAKAHFREGLALGYELGDVKIICETLCRQGELYLARQELDQASAAFLQSTKAARQAQLDELIGLALYGLARVEAVQGYTVKARHLGRESLTILKATGHHQATLVSQWLGELAEIA